MSVEDPTTSYNRQLADKALIFIEPKVANPLLNSTLELYLPSFKQSTYSKIIVANLSARETEMMFAVQFSVNSAPVRSIINPATAEEIAQIVAVAKLSTTLNPEFVRTLTNSARLRLLEMEQEVARIRQQI